MDDLSTLLPMLEGHDRLRCLKRLRTGEINEDEFMDIVADLAMEKLMSTLHLHNPDLPTPDMNDPNVNLSGFFSGMLEAVGAGRVEYQKVMKRVQNARGVVNTIFDNWEKLQSIVSSHSRILGKRWSKKDENKRRALLLKAWPNMSSVRRPDFNVIIDDRKGPSQRHALMMPHINLEDLSSHSNLLHLISSRSQMDPGHFARTDCLRFDTALAMKAVKPAKPWKTVMLLTGQRTRDEYGRLFEIEGAADSENILCTNFGFFLGQGLLVLKLQKQMYSFLVKCTELLLHDMDLSELTAVQYPMISYHHELLGEPIITAEDTVWQSVSEMNTKLSYDLPRPFSVDSLRKLAAAKCDEVEDFCWALLEDPAIFQEQLKLRVGQATEPYRKIIEEKAFNNCSNPKSSILGSASMKMIYCACRDIIMWHSIASDLIEIEKQRNEVEAHIELCKRLPRSYEEPMENLISLTFLVWNHAVQDMHLVLMSSAEFIQFFEMKPAENGEYVDWKVKKSTKDQWPQILHLLMDLNDWKKTKLMGALNILDEMERVMNSDKMQHDMVGAEMAKEISKLAALAQIRDSLVRHEPTIQCCRDAEEVVHGQRARLQPIDDLENILKLMPLAKYVNPMPNVPYPAEKKRTCQHIEQMRLAEQKLDSFWEHVDDDFVATTGKTLRQWMGSRLTARELQRTQPWQPTEQEQQFRMKVDRTTPETTTFHTRPASQTFDKLSTEPRKKQKTRGESDSNRSSSTPEPDFTRPQEPDPSIQIFSLPSRALRTMSALYPISTEDRKGRTVIWRDFLHAMYNLGFGIQKRHGSEWYFEPFWKRNAPITIHEPHPKHEMGFSKMRFEANRMARKYGWTSESFQEA